MSIENDMLRAIEAHATVVDRLNEGGKDRDRISRARVLLDNKRLEKGARYEIHLSRY